MAPVTRATLVLLVVTLVSSAHSKGLFEECQSAFNNLGGTEGIKNRLSSCGGGFATINQCCDQAKGVLQSGPDGCICDADVWAMVERQLLEANINNLNSNTLRVFLNYCGIPNYGSSSC